MNPTRLGLFALLLLLAACQSATIESNSKSGYDFTDLRTYYWISPDRAGLTGMDKSDRAFSKALSKVVAEEFGERGYTQDDRDPDFVVLVAASARRGGQRRSGPAWDYAGPTSGSRTARTRIRGTEFNYEEGVIMIWVFETKTGDELFDVWARDAIKESDPPTAEGVVKVVREMMSRFPGRVTKAGS